MERIHEITKNIIKESIKKVICIDDEFLQPYSKNSDQEINNIAKEIYESFSGEYNCLLDIVKYNTQNQCISKFHNKDLLILDWELIQSEPKYSEALSILEMATISDIPFICIYTQTPSIESVYDRIFEYFSGYTKKDIDEIKNITYEFTLDEILEKYFSEISEIISGNKCLDGVITKIYENMNKKDIIELNKKKIKINNDFLKKWYFSKINCYLPDRKFETIPPVKIIKEGVTSAINLNGKILLVMQKLNKNDNSNNIGKVSPLHLLDKFSENIAEEPNNLFNIIWFQYKNYFNKIIYKQADFFQNVTQDAFIHHYKQLAKEEALHGNETNSFDSFLKGLYKDDLRSKLNAVDFKTDESLVNYISEFPSNPNEEDLIKLNYYYSVDKEISDNNRNIHFGDIFKCIKGAEGLYFICITAHCDCLRPKKINNNYFFVIGTKEDDNIEALNNAEKDQYSFIFDSRYKSIKWLNKLVTLHIDENSKLIDKTKDIETYYKNKTIKIEYVCNLKENYTQRIANWAFGNANKVGITYAKFDSENSEEPEKISNVIKPDFTDPDKDLLENHAVITSDDVN